MEAKLHKNLCDNIIENDGYDTIIKFLKQQPEQELKMFLYCQNFEYSKDKESLIKQELERRASKRSTKEKWWDRFFGSIGTIIISIIVYMATQFIKGDK